MNSPKRRSDINALLTSAVAMWLRAAERQRDRAMDESADQTERKIDAIFFVIAIRNIRLALNRLVRLDAAPGYAEAMRAIFDEAVPSIDDLRHALEHYDEYVLGLGNAQKAKRFSEWKFGLEDLEGDTIFRLGEFSIKIAESYTAAEKTFQRMFVVFQEILNWPDSIQELP